MRLVVEGDRVVVDTPGYRGGRGAWVCPQPMCLERAQARVRVLQKALRNSSCRPIDLRAAVLETSRAAAAAHLVRCHRSGLVVAGPQRILHQDVGAAVALVAAEGAGRVALDAARERCPETPCVSIGLDTEGLGRLLGRGPRSVIAILPGAPSRALLRELRRCSDLG